MATERWVRLTVGAVLIAAAAYSLYRLRFVVTTIALAAMLAYALLPLVEYVARLRVGGRAVPRIVATALVFSIVIVVAVNATHFAATPVGEQAPRFAQTIGQYLEDLNASLSRAKASLEEYLPPDVHRVLDNAINQSGAFLVGAFGHVARTTAEWLSHVIEVVLIPILAFYFLVDLPVLKQELVGFLPAATRPRILQAAARLDRILAAYVRGQLILMFISAVVVWAGLTLMGVRLALLLGIVAGLTRVVPIIGPVLGAIPIVGIVLLQSDQAAAAALLFFVVLQIIESKVILPQIVGYHLQLHAVTILIALLIGNALFGLIGMFLAPPAAAFARDILDLIDQRHDRGPLDSRCPERTP
jgi:predicted PurR-regulated permease PerM